MAFDILVYDVLVGGLRQLDVQPTTSTATIIDENTITFDGGVTTQTYTYLGQGFFRGTTTSGEFIEVDGQIYVYNTDDPTGTLPVGNWKITQADLNPVNPPCFLRGTMILTPDGEVAVEDISAGDLVRTRSGDDATVVWAGHNRVAPSRLQRNPALRPVRIAAGVVGNGSPLCVSQQHRLLLTGWRAELWFGEPEILVPAKALIGSDGVSLMPDDEAVDYYHLLLESHEILIADGAYAESLFLGDQMPMALTAEIGALFPDLLPRMQDMPAAAPVLTVGEGKLMQDLAAM